MITLDAPHMGLNDARAPVRTRMWNTWEVPASTSRAHLIDWVAKVADNAPGGKIKNLVFNCHGAPGYLQMGEGIQRPHLTAFARWRQKIEKIWIRACNVAFISGGSDANRDGNMFCAELARAAQCYVVASTELQAEYGGRVLPYGQLDTYEGLVLSYGPQGTVTWSHRYRSTWNDSNGWHRNPD
jgi:hypothetical protein